MSPASDLWHFAWQLTVGFRCIPIMISRIILSLRKAADLSQDGWNITGQRTDGNAPRSMLVFSSFPWRGRNDTGDSAPLDTLRES